MLFDLQEDLGFKISAYVVPDSGGKTPSLCILNKGVELLRIQANLVIPALVAAGRHSTGLCGYTIDERILPGLSKMTELELVEQDTGLLIYRRPPADVINDLKVFRLETHLLPLWRLDEVLKPRFQQWYKGIERSGLETSTQVFCLSNCRSLYISGRLLYKNYELYLKKGIKVAVLLRDPYDELAERLLVLKNVASRAEAILGPRDAMSLAPIIDALNDLHEFTPETCKKLFRQASKLIFDCLANPIVRQLTTSVPNEALGRSAITAALEVLASFELVGLRSHSEEFSGALAEMLVLDHAALPTLGEHDRITEFSKYLRSLPAVESLLEKDLELFHVVFSAFKTVTI
jgi:hypothetical protein